MCLKSTFLARRCIEHNLNSYLSNPDEYDAVVVYLAF